MTTRGSCLCRAVRWEVEGELEWMSHCHCSMCRKEHGALFGTYVMARAGDLRFTSGEDRISRFESSPGGNRSFCSTCGSVVPGTGGELAFLPAGCLDDDPGVRPVAHIFAASKAPWYEIPDDGVARHDEYPPGYPAPELPARPLLPAASAPGRLRGSCLCAGVVFEVGRPRAIVHCHCSRCRKGRSAAHASNLFAEREGSRFVRGEELVSSYKVPEAERFTVAFCRQCGSSVPRFAGDAPFVGVPSGSLDDDPGALPSIHVFVASKAPWFEIHDDLPRHDAYPPGCRSSFEWVAQNS